MIPKNNRIKKKNDFSDIFKKGGSIKSRAFILKKLKNNLGRKRIAVVVSNKVFKKAVQRNKIRRRIYYIVKNHFKDSTDYSYDLVFLTLPTAREMSFNDLKVEIIKLLNK